MNSARLDSFKDRGTGIAIVPASVRAFAPVLPGALAFAFALVFACACSPSPASAGGERGAISAVEAARHTVLVVTGEADATPDEWRAAEALATGAMPLPPGVQVLHKVIPSDKWRRSAEYAAELERLLAPADFRAVVVAPSPRGASAALASFKQSNPEVVAVFVEPVEDPMFVQRVADLALNVDYLSRPWALFQVARKAGARGIVDIANPSGEGFEPFDRKRLAIKYAAEEAGFPVVSIRYRPDPKTAESPAAFFARTVPAALESIQGPAWVVCDRGIPMASLYPLLVKARAFLLEEDVPSMSAGFFEAIGLDPATRWDVDAAKAAEKAVIAAGAAGLFGYWPEAWGSVAIRASLHHLGAVFAGKARIDRLSDVLAAFTAVASGAVWRFSYYPDAFSGVDARSHVLAYQDPYVFGRGFVSLTKYEPPAALKTLQPKGDLGD